MLQDTRLLHQLDSEARCHSVSLRHKWREALNHRDTSIVLFLWHGAVSIPDRCKGWLKMIKCICKIPWPFYLLPSLICCVFLFKPLFYLAWPLLLFRSCYGSLRPLYLSPLPKSLILFLLMAWLLSLWACWHSFPFLPPAPCLRGPVTPADTCAFVLLYASHKPPALHALGWFSSYPCLWLCWSTVHCFTWLFS